MPVRIPESVQLPELSQRILNIAAYKFVNLDNLIERRREMLGVCRQLDLRGTILLSIEGINLFLAGPRENVRQFLDWLRSDPAFTDIDPKESYSEQVPFRRMLVRLKREIISMGVPNVKPAVKTSPKLPAQELKRWLDEGRPVRLLDTRNDYEVDLGTFTGAEHLSIGHFRQFPDAVTQLPDEAKRQPLVMFCTGGIRCEKAGPLMEQAGFEQVFQLDGGILKYFEECGGAHYDGACFVFDSRVAVDPQLQPTGNLLCYVCQAVLTTDEVTSNEYAFGKHCPYCYASPQALAVASFAARQENIARFAYSQPGCTPYTNQRKIHVPGRFAGRSMINFLVDYQPAIGREQWLAWLRAGQITPWSPQKPPPAAALDDSALPGTDVVDRQIVDRQIVDRQIVDRNLEQRIVREGECFIHLMPNTVEPPIAPNIKLLHEDEWLVVVDKPAPLPAHPSGRYNKNTLLHLVSDAYPNEKLRVAHRLDSDTTGVVVLCRKHQSARFVQPQFAEERVVKQYLARVQGHPPWDAICCELPISPDPIPEGGRKVAADGDRAATEVSVLKRFSDGTSLVDVRPKTGRTHQIRLHLLSLGHPIVGDRLYGFDGPSFDGPNADDQTPIPVASSPSANELSCMCLHAFSVAFQHPGSRLQVVYCASQPDWVHDEPR